MTSQELLKNWNPLTHGERVKRCYELGRESDNIELINELERGDSFERRLAVQTIAGSKDVERALRLSGDASRIIRRKAQKFLVEYATVEQILDLFSSLTPSSRRGLIKVLKQKHRRDAVDAICEALQGATEEWWELAPFASRDYIRQWIEANFEKTFEKASTYDWYRLATNHPQLASEKLRERLQSRTQRDSQLVQRINAALPAITQWQPDQALELVTALLAHEAPLEHLDLSPLLSFRAEALAQLILKRTDKDEVALDFSGVAHRLQYKTLVTLLKKNRKTLTFREVWLKRIPHQWRGDLWAEFGRGWRNSEGLVNIQTLKLLPRHARVSEATRHLELPSLAAKPENWLPYAAFLDYEIAKEKIAPLLGDSDPTLRAAAHRALASCVRFARDYVGDLLEVIKKRGNEQDPIRAAMLEGLANLPPSVWQESQLETLAIIQRQALDARGLSIGAASHLERLLVSLLAHFPVWAATQLSILVKEGGHVISWNMQDRINDGAMEFVGPSLIPVLQGWTQRDHTPFLGAMSSFGRRLKVWDEGAYLLADFAKNGPATLTPQAVGILAKSRRDVFAQLVPQLLQIDESWGTQPVIYNYIHRTRQDLWTPALLGREPIRGRFQTSQTRFIPGITKGFDRWNVEQQQLFALSLGEVISDAERDTPTTVRSVLSLAELPDVDPRPLLQLAALENPKLALREAALRVLSRLDGGQGVPVLIEALDDERARIAIYSLRRILVEMPESRAMDILRATPMQRVTVAKEVLRLLGDLKSQAALELLFEFADQDLHRDVRVALLRAFWDYLEDERVWPILEEAANSKDAAIAAMVARTTAPRLTKTTRRRLNSLLARLLSHPEPRVRLSVLQQSAARIHSDPEKQLLEPLLVTLDSKLPEEYSATIRAILNLYTDNTDTERELIVAAIFKRVLSNRQKLSAILDQFTPYMRYGYYKNVSKTVLDVLATDPLLLSARLEMAVGFLAPVELAATIETELDNQSLHAEAFMKIIRLLDSYFGDDQTKRLSFLSQRWLTSSSPELRRLALAAVMGQSRGYGGWNTHLLTQLKQLKNDESPLVAAAAQWVFPNATEKE